MRQLAMLLRKLSVAWLSHAPAAPRAWPQDIAHASPRFTRRLPPAKLQAHSDRHCTSSVLGFVCLLKSAASTSALVLRRFPSSQSAPEDEVCPAGQAEAVQAQAAIAHHLGGTTRLQVPAQRMSPRAHLQSAGTPRHCRSPGSAGKAGQSPNVSPGLRAHRVAASAARLGSAIAEAATGERKATAALGRDVAAQAAARGPANPQPAAASPPRKVARKLAVPATGPGDSVVGGTRSARRTSDLHKLSPLQGRASADQWQRAGRLGGRHCSGACCSSKTCWPDDTCAVGKLHDLLSNAVPCRYPLPLVVAL